MVQGEYTAMIRGNYVGPNGNNFTAGELAEGGGFTRETLSASLWVILRNMPDRASGLVLLYIGMYSGSFRLNQAGVQDPDRGHSRAPRCVDFARPPLEAGGLWVYYFHCYDGVPVGGDTTGYRDQLFAYLRLEPKQGKLVVGDLQASSLMRIGKIVSEDGICPMFYTVPAGCLSVGNSADKMTTSYNQGRYMNYNYN